MRASILFAVLTALLSGCAITPRPPAVPLPAPQGALTLIKLPPSHAIAFEDDLDTASLRTAALQSVAYYRSRLASEQYTLATDTYTAADLADSMAYFVDVLDQSPTPQSWREAVRRDFQVYQSVGTDPQRTVTFSSYYEPSIPARHVRGEIFKYPIYARPPDLIDVDLGQFDSIYQGARIAGRRQGKNLVPYYTRADIDSRKVLKSHTPVLAWAKNPSDIYFLQIEGSGWLDLGGKKKVRIRYDGTNGRRYRSAGVYLSNQLSKKGLSHDEFEEYLRKHPKERQAILNYNERYVFFRIDHSSSSPFAFGNLEVPLTPWRSVATDPKLFPKGLLAWIETDQPVLDANERASGTRSVKRFVLNQDEGGAIQGPGRVDYFAGDGKDALRFATHFWQKGTLYFLVKKKRA
jgi:membrane-bound lytic murein transglycosylase A